MNKIFCALMLCIIGGSSALSFAGPSPRPLSSAELAKQLGQYQKIRALEASFEQVKEMKSLQLKLKSSGHFRLVKEKGQSVVEWQLNQPSYLKLRITASSIEISDQPGEPGKPVVESKEMQAKILRPLYAWLSMNGEMIAEQYEIFSAGKNQFRLLPRDKSSPVKAISLQLDGKQLVSQVALEESSGDELRIRFSDSKGDFLP